MNVFINGVMMRPSHDYVLGSDHIDFRLPPPAGYQIDLKEGIWWQAIKVDGIQTTFKIDPSWQEMRGINNIIVDAWGMREHPMVQDALERLQSAIALVKE